MTKRKRRKSDYHKFLATVAPDLMISQRMLKRHDPSFDPHKHLVASLANQTKRSRLEGRNTQSEQMMRVQASISRLASPQTAGSKYRPFLQPVQSKTEAFIAINEIYKKRKATLDKRIFILKSKKRELAKLQAETLHSLETEQEAEDPFEPSVSIFDSSEEEEELADPRAKKIDYKYKKGKVRLFSQRMFNDTCKHILDRDELSLYFKRIKRNKVEEELRVLNFKMGGKAFDVYF